MNSNNVKIAAVAHFSPHFLLALNAIEMDGITSVVKYEGKNKIYSSMMMKSYLTPTWQITRKSSLYASVGGVLTRSSRLTDRKLSKMFDFRNKESKRHFEVAD